MRLSPGTRLGPYEIRALLGVGGMGEVYRAHDSRLGRDVAVKVLPESVSEDRERLKRFEQEARAAAALNHPNILAVYDVGSHEGSPYIVSELLLGETLRERLSSGAMTVQQALEVATPIARALAAANEKGIVHRDLKPENVFLTRDDQVKVLDFGLAKLRPSPEELASGSPTATRPTADGVVMGTVAYMSPEQVRGQSTGASSDLFSFGVVLYEMLGGRRPFVGESTADVMAAILNQAPAKLEVPVSPLLERITERCLEKRPEDRFHSAHHLALALEAFSHAESVPTTTAARPLTRRRWILVAALLLLGTGIGWILWRSRSSSETLTPITSIAVLPLKNYSGDSSQDFFAEGMTDALIADLAQIRALKVISRTSVMQYKDAKKPLPEIARELGVEGILEGSVMRSGNRVRVTAQLIDGREDRHVWAENYERELTDVLALQGEVVRAIAEQVRVQVTRKERERLTNRVQVNPRAYELYLKGNFQLARASEEAIGKALEYFEQAIEIDPNYAEAYAGLSFTYSALGGWFASSPSSSMRAKARDAATRAVELNESLAEAQVALGDFKYLYEWDWAGAERALRRGLELGPASSYARLEITNFSTAMGRFDEAIALGERSVEVDPLSPAVYNELGFPLSLSGQNDEAIEVYRKGLELDPNFAQSLALLATTHLRNGNPVEALAVTEKWERVTPDLKDDMAGRGYIYGKTGHHDRAREILDRLESRAKKEYVSPQNLALVHIGLGEHQRALDLLERAFEERDVRLVFLKVVPIYDPLRRDPRFQRLLERMSFPD